MYELLPDVQRKYIILIIYVISFKRKLYNFFYIESEIGSTYIILYKIIINVYIYTHNTIEKNVDE